MKFVKIIVPKNVIVKKCFGSLWFHYVFIPGWFPYRKIDNSNTNIKIFLKFVKINVPKKMSLLKNVLAVYGSIVFLFLIGFHIQRYITLNGNGYSVVLFLIGYTHNALDPGVSLSVVVAVVEPSQPVLLMLDPG